MMYFERKEYLDKLISAEGNGMIKIITGIRRCGKSFLLFNIFRKHLLERGVTENHIIQVNLEDRRNRKLRDPDALLEYIDAQIVNKEKFYFKGLFLTAVFALLGCLSIQAANEDLITKQITIKLDEAGTLSNKIGSRRKYNITNLKIIGEINGTDWRMIREMAGRNFWGDVTDGLQAEMCHQLDKIIRHE